MKNCIFFTYLLSLNFYVFSQQDNPLVYYNEFDKVTQSDLNDFNIGLRFTDEYRVISNNQFRYFNSSQYEKGYVMYNSQPFYNCMIKYDLLEDNLHTRNNLSTGSYDIILGSDKIQTFTINNINFVKLPIEASKFSFYKNGFFEKIIENTTFKVYIKHRKNEEKLIKDKSIFYEFSYSETYVFEYQSHFYLLKSKKDLIKIFPDQKKQIQSFYNDNKILEKSDLRTFTIKLLEQLRGLIHTEDY